MFLQEKNAVIRKDNKTIDKININWYIENMKCLCGCGQNIEKAKYPYLQKKYIFTHRVRLTKRPGKEFPCPVCGKPIYRKPYLLKKHKFNTCSRKCRSIFFSRNFRGNKANNWRGGKGLTIDGYYKIYYPSHPFANKHGYILEHRLIMEKMINRYLTPKDIVHHKNGTRTDNRKKNLDLITAGKHTCIHLPRLGTGKKSKYSSEAIAKFRHRDIPLH